MLELAKKIILAIRKILGYGIDDSDTSVPPEEYPGYKCRIINQKDPERLKKIEDRLKIKTSVFFEFHSCSKLCSWIEVEYNYSAQNAGWIFISCWRLVYKTSWKDAPPRFRLYDHALVVYDGGSLGFFKNGNVHTNNTPIFSAEFSSENLINSDNLAVSAVLNTVLLLKKKKHTDIMWGSSLNGNLKYARQSR